MISFLTPQLWELPGLTVPAPRSAVPVFSGRAALPAGPNGIPARTYHFTALVESCPELSHLRTAPGAQFIPVLLEGTSGQECILGVGYIILIPGTTSLPTCAAAKPAAACPLEGEGEQEISTSRKHGCEAGFSYRTLLREPCSLLQGRSPLCSPEGWSPLGRYPSTARFGGLPVDQTASCRHMQPRSERESPSRGARPGTKPGRQQAAAATNLGPAFAGQSLTQVLVFSQARCSFRSSQLPALDSHHLPRAPATPPHTPGAAEGPGASPHPGSSWSSISPHHWVAGPRSGASLMVFAMTPAPHPHQLPDTGGRDTFLFTSGAMAEPHVILTGTRSSISCLNDAATNIYCHKRGYSNTSN